MKTERAENNELNVGGVWERRWARVGDGPWGVGAGAGGGWVPELEPGSGVRGIEAGAGAPGRVRRAWVVGAGCDGRGSPGAGAGVGARAAKLESDCGGTARPGVDFSIKDPAAPNELHSGVDFSALQLVRTGSARIQVWSDLKIWLSLVSPARVSSHQSDPIESPRPQKPVGNHGFTPRSRGPSMCSSWTWLPCNFFFVVVPFTSHMAPHAKPPSGRSRKEKKETLGRRSALCFARRDMTCRVGEGHADAGYRHRHSPRFPGPTRQPGAGDLTVRHLVAVSRWPNEL
jgi:hypothetical protein